MGVDLDPLKVSNRKDNHTHIPNLGSINLQAGPDRTVPISSPVGQQLQQIAVAAVATVGEN
jgi:hypothetical protein